MALPSSPTSLVLLAGTREGLYVFTSCPDRRKWQCRGPYLDGLDVSHAVLDPRDGRTIYAAAIGNGCTAVYRSRDLGFSWEMPAGEFETDQVWHVEPGPACQPGRLYAGVMPATLYQSDDWGDSWSPLWGLTEHPTREEWWEGGAGGIYLHRIMIDPVRPERLYAGISVAGLFRSDDGGRTWLTRNIGVEVPNDLMDPAKVSHPDVHRCIHSAVIHPHQPDILFQQNHFGVYRSDDAGDSWVDISAGLPDRFGFVCGISHEETPAFFVVPQSMEQIRYSGQLTVYRTRDGGSTWQALTDGLPVVDHLTLYREGMTTDPFDPAGVYFGTSDGHLWASRDGGDHWEAMAEGLPGVRSVTCRPVSAD